MTPSLIRKHRTKGPFLLVLSLFGFFSGIIIVFIHFGRVVKYLPHLAAGSALILCIVMTYAISRRIRVGAPDGRALHFALGAGILILYIAQAFLGIGILL